MNCVILLLKLCTVQITLIPDAVLSLFGTRFTAYTRWAFSLISRGLFGDCLFLNWSNMSAWQIYHRHLIRKSMNTVRLYCWLKQVLVGIYEKTKLWRIFNLKFSGYNDLSSAAWRRMLVHVFVVHHVAVYIYVWDCGCTCIFACAYIYIYIYIYISMG